MINKELLIQEFNNELARITGKWDNKVPIGKEGILSRGMDYQIIFALKQFIQRFDITDKDLGITDKEIIDLIK